MDTWHGTKLGPLEAELNTHAPTDSQSHLARTEVLPETFTIFFDAVGISDVPGTSGINVKVGISDVPRTSGIDVRPPTLASAESGNVVATASGNVAAMALDDDLMRCVDDDNATFVRDDATGNKSG
jgi:hypothetical protein